MINNLKIKIKQMLNKEQSAGTIAEQGTNAEDMHVQPHSYLYKSNITKQE